MEPLKREQIAMVEALKGLLAKAEAGDVESLRYVVETSASINVGQHAVVPVSVSVVGSLEMLHKDCLEKLVAEFRSSDRATENR